MTEREIIQKLIVMTGGKIDQLTRVVKLDREDPLYIQQRDQYKECLRWLGEKANELNRSQGIV